jgi:CRISPR type I-D-associated protein Csc1
MEAYRCILSAHDFLFYVSKELKVGVPSDIISNTALLYAFNSHTTAAHRNASGNTPHYQEDMARFSIYSTPAKLLGRDLVIMRGELEEWGGVSRNLERLTYNAVQTVNNITDSTQVVPSMGHYMMYPPLTPFECFLIGGRGSAVIRLGKKLPPVRAVYQRLENVEHNTGTFRPSHPVNSKDIHQATEILECSVEVMPPAPVYRTSKLKGDHITGEIQGKKYRVALPNPDIYSSIDLS